ncbi:MAG: GNAT family N-acetyltransferase [Dehalococcoidia bacterium]
MTDDLTRRALAVNEAQLALASLAFDTDGAHFVRNPDFPRVHDANHASHVTAATPDEIDRLLARVEREFAGLAHRVFHTDATTPPAFEARLALEGYAPSDTIVMLLEGPLRFFRGRTPACDIRPAGDEARWAAYAALRLLDGDEYLRRTGRSPDPAFTAEMTTNRRRMSPPVRVWLAHADGAPVGYCSSWEGTEGVGLVEDLFVHPDARRRGIATALLHHCVADARASMPTGDGPVVITADPTDTPGRIYANLGWRPTALKRSWLRIVEP